MEKVEILLPFSTNRKMLLYTHLPLKHMPLVSQLWVWLFRPEIVTTGKPQPQKRES